MLRVSRADCTGVGAGERVARLAIPGIHANLIPDAHLAALAIERTDHLLDGY
jgi:hypothetical protein